uniref:Uncharacterized protein n=1 Tax=Anguilla anguilla TaxID=7936 RepID=A0A0E9PWP1_ANGAN
MDYMQMHKLPVYSCGLHHSNRTCILLLAVVVWAMRQAKLN